MATSYKLEDLLSLILALSKIIKRQRLFYSALLFNMYNSYQLCVTKIRRFLKSVENRMIGARDSTLVQRS